MASRGAQVSGFYRSLDDFNHFLESVKKKKREILASKEYFEVERVISRRSRRGNIEYLIKWKNYSSYDCSWEDESHLTTDLISSFERPLVCQNRADEHKDILFYNITVKLKSKSRSPHLFFFNHDIFRHFFYNKGTTSRDGKALMLSSSAFNHLNLPFSWDQFLDKNGDGVAIQFPIRMQVHLSWSPKLTTFQDGKLVASPRMPLEKVSVQFICQPFSISNI